MTALHSKSKQQVTIFDAMASRRLKERGMELAAAAKQPLLTLARIGAAEIARRRDSRCVTADDVQQFLVDEGLDEGSLGNAAGSVFKDRTVWKFEGYEKSKRELAHARVIAVWRYIGT